MLHVLFCFLMYLYMELESVKWIVVDKVSLFPLFFNCVCCLCACGGSEVNLGCPPSGAKHFFFHIDNIYFDSEKQIYIIMFNRFEIFDRQSTNYILST